MSTLKRICTLVLAISMMIAYFPADQIDVHAAGRIGRLNNKDYDDFDDLIDDLEDNYKNKAVTIEMLTNWDANVDSDYDERLIIPAGCQATLNMNGWVFDRCNNIDNDWSYNGELICVESGATLTVNGGKKNLHYENVYSSTSRSGKATASKAFYGGVLTGGASTGGAGGIHVKSSCTVTLNDVTLAGCRAEAPWYDSAGTNSAYGGGIWLTGGDSNLRLNHSTITGCFAYYDGGGIFQSNHNYVNIELNDSHIDFNYAADEGGGIDIDGEYVHITGRNDSTISGNQSATAGGGIYIWNDDSSLSGVTLKSNSSKNGGAIYTKEETVSLSGLTVMKNTASERGGGIYINNDGNTISSCEITGNRASLSGGGVYVNDDVDEKFSVTGKTIIKDNTADTFNDSRNNNLYISDNDPDDSKVAFNLTKGSDVHLGYYNTEDRDAIMVNRDGKDFKDINCIQFLTADNPGYHLTYNSRPNYRKIFYVKDGKDDVNAYGEQAQKANDPTDVSAKNANGASNKTASDHSTSAGVVGKVAAGGEKSADGEYDLIRGFYTHEKTDSDTEDTDASFYYSDAFFDADPVIYNEHLATASWVLAFSGTYLRKFDDEDANGNIYYNKHAGARQFLADIGCPDENIYVNESMTSKPGTDSIGVTIGSKELAKTGGEKTGEILIPVTVRGGGYESEWASNVTLGKAADIEGKEAQGFAEAANEVTKEIREYIKNYGLEDKIADGKVVFWVSGFSRAGATANLTAKRLVEKYACDEEGKKNKVFAYPCEAPKGGSDAAQQKSDDKYFCIHNMINAVDIVPLVATTQMGAKRYGVDHYIPGSDKYTFSTGDEYDKGAYFSDKQTSETDVTITGGYTIKKTMTSASQGGTDGPTTVTTYRDNNIRLQSNFKDGDEDGSVEANEFYRKGMLPHLRAMDSGMTYDNYFHPMTMDFIPPKMKEYGYYKGNHIEYFVLDFVRLLQEGNGTDEWSKAVTSRDYWATTLQPVMRDTMALVFSMSGDNSAGFVGRASSIMDKINYVGGEVSMWELYRNVIGEWNELSQEDKDKYTTFLLKKLKETGAFDFLSESDRAKLEANWPTLADFIFHITDCDYSYKPVEKSDGSLTSRWGKGDSSEKDTKMALVPTFATFSSFILQNHYPEFNIAWTRSYDSYYADETTEYEIVTNGYTVDKPTLTLKNSSGEEKELKEGTQFNIVTGNQELIFDVDDIAGEAVYYNVYKETGTNRKNVKNQLYRKGDTIAQDASLTQAIYTVEAYAMSYGVKSDVATYKIIVYSGRHRMTINDLSPADGKSREQTQLGKEGDDIRIYAGVPADKYFKEWNVSLLAANNSTILKDDITDALLEDKTNGIASFKMPEAGSKIGSTNEEYPDGFNLKLDAIYGDRVTTVTASPAAPVSGEQLADKAEVSFNNDAESKEYPINWSYTYTKDDETKTVQTSGKALDSTEYTATIHIPQEEAEKIIFARVLSGTSDTGEIKSVTRDSSDGSATIVMTMPETEDTGENPRPDTDISITVRAKDLNRPSDDPYDPDVDPIEIDVYKNDEFVLTAPDVPGERFVDWSIDDADADIHLIDSSKTDRTIRLKLDENISSTSFEIDAEYVPVISEIEASLDAPEGGKKMPEDPVVTVKIDNTYEIHPDFVKLTWAPAPLGQDDEEKTADYLTPYTATVTVEPKQKEDEDGNPVIGADGNPKMYIKAKRVKDAEGNPVTDEDYSETSAIFFYSDDIDVKMNDETAAYDTGANSLSYMFPKTTYTLASVEKPADITDVPHGTDAAGIKELLPETTKITTENGVTLDADITWDDPAAPVTEDTREEMLWTVHGQVTLPDSVSNPEEAVDTSFDISVTVKEAGYIASPIATLASGTYLHNQVTYIDATEGDGYTTYYTLDGTDPDEGSTAYEAGTEILINREDAVDGRIILKAKTVKADMWDSRVTTYVYDFTNDVDVPSADDPVYNGKQQTGIGSSQFYTASVEEGSGATVDQSGNVVATEPGTYKVTLKIADGFRWKIKKAEPDDTDEDYEYTTDDQTVEFRIRGIDISNVKFSTIKTKVYTGKAIKPSFKVTLNGTVLKAGTDYTVIYSSNKKVGLGKAIVAGKGHYSGVSSRYAKFKIVPKKAAIKKAKVGKKKVTLRLKTKVAKTGGNKYQIKYRIKGKKKWKTKTTKKIKIVLKKLKKGKKYQIKARAFRKVGKKKYYGKWSKVKVTKKIRK